MRKPAFTFTFKIDEYLLEETKNQLKKAVELPGRKVAQSVKDAMKIPLGYAKYLLRDVPDNYKMKFKDGNTWTKDDVIKNLYLKKEKSYSKDKVVYRLGIRDWRVNYYANFVEFGYTNPKSGDVHEATHFMRRSLDDNADILTDQVIARLLQNLYETGLIE